MLLPWGTPPFPNLRHPKSGVVHRTCACPVKVNVRTLSEAPRRLLFSQLPWTQFPGQLACNPKWRTCLRIKPVSGRKPSELGQALCLGQREPAPDNTAGAQHQDHFKPALPWALQRQTWITFLLKPIWPGYHDT